MSLMQWPCNRNRFIEYLLEVPTIYIYISYIYIYIYIIYIYVYIFIIYMYIYL